MTLRGHREVSQNDIDFAGFEELDSGRGLYRDILDVDPKVFANAIAVDNVISRIVAALINGAEGRLISKDADAYAAGLFILFPGGAILCGICRGRLPRCFRGTLTARGQGQR